MLENGLGMQDPVGVWDPALLRVFESELGLQDLVGFRDPVGFTSDGAIASFKRPRSVELKHGRISMMATIGLSTTTETLHAISTLKICCKEVWRLLKVSNTSLYVTKR